MPEPTQTILLAEEDPLSRSFLSEQLSFDGYEVIEADSRAKALAILGTRQPDLLIADVNGETLSLIDAVREADGLASRIDPGTPMLVLSARAEELARVRYLERGSDDVLAKPYSYTELRARIGALLRRSRHAASGRLVRIGALRIDLAAREVWLDGVRVSLTAKEYDLLRCLAARADAGVHAARSCCATCGATRAGRGRAPWTATRHGSGRNSTGPASSGSSSTSGASAGGSPTRQR